MQLTKPLPCNIYMHRFFFLYRCVDERVCMADGAVYVHRFLFIHEIFAIVAPPEWVAAEYIYCWFFL